MSEKVEENCSISIYKIFSNIGFLLSPIIISKKCRRKKIISTEQKIRCYCNKGFVEDIFPPGGKTASNGRVIGNIRAKWCPLSRKSVSTIQNEVFVEK